MILRCMNARVRGTWGRGVVEFLSALEVFDKELLRYDTISTGEGERVVCSPSFTFCKQRHHYSLCGLLPGVPLDRGRATTMAYLGTSVGLEVN